MRMGAPIRSAIMAAKRTSRVMVRLAPGKDTPPDEVRFTPAERLAVEDAMGPCGYTAISTFIRETGVEAARMTVARSHGGQVLDDYQTCKTAAEECGLPLGEWLRLMVLAGVDHNPLHAHMGAAKDYVETRPTALAEAARKGPRGLGGIRG
jgi:hypothetical protein